MPVRSIHFYVNSRKPRAQAVCESLSGLAAKLGLEAVSGGEADVVLALGGDGPMLRAVHECPGTPVLGLNLGGLGYLSSVGEGDFGRAVEMLARGEFQLAERSALAVRKFRRGAEMRRPLRRRRGIERVSNGDRIAARTDGFAQSDR